MDLRLTLATGPAGTRRHPVAMDELRHACATVAARATQRAPSSPRRSRPTRPRSRRARRRTPEPDGPQPQAPPHTPATREDRGRLLADAGRHQLRLGLVSDAAQARRPLGLQHDRRRPARPLRPPRRLDRRRSSPSSTPPPSAPILGQDPDHELMALYAASLRDLGEHVAAEHGGRFAAVADAAGGSAVALARRLGALAVASPTSRATTSSTVPFLKRAQIAAADLAPRRRGRASPTSTALTMFADNLVPHVLRLDGILRFDPELVGPDRPRGADRPRLARGGRDPRLRRARRRAARGRTRRRRALSAAALDQLLWQRGQQPRYKASPRHRSRCTAY